MDTKSPSRRFPRQVSRSSPEISGFEIEKETFNLMLEHKSKLKDITAERKLIELEKGIKGNFVLDARPDLSLPENMEYVFSWIRE